MSDTIRTIDPGEMEMIAVRGTANTVQRQRKALANGLTARDVAIRAAVDAGRSVAEVGRAAGVTRERAQQIAGGAA